MTSVRPARTARIPQAGKYSFWELERRFLLETIPAGFVARSEVAIHDRYLAGTRLRLRRLEDRATGEVALKLAQKLVPDDADFSRVEITNIYLPRADYDLLATLPAHVLEKVRITGSVPGTRASPVGVDVFGGPHRGLLLATVDFDDEPRMRAWEPPSWLGREVSGELGYTGGELARAAAAGA